MSQGRNIKVKNRLGPLMSQPGGRSVVEALRGAEKRMDKIKDECLEALDRSIARLDQAAAKLVEPADPATVTEIYQASNDMIAMAGLVGFESLDEVAHGLCEMIDVFRAQQTCSEEAIRVHVNAVQLLRGMSKEDSAAREKVLSGLRKVWVRLGVREAPAGAAG
ncbi:MAG: hypothetical protein P4L64_00055 [Caulobacteraceae bacterium]|nr:hypothetical protein [Caulobacteraceae bacterium]